jgi:hypothetical protein
MRSMQCNVEFGYQLSIRSRTKENLDRVGFMGRTNSLLSFDKTRTAEKTLKLGGYKNT